MRGIDRSSVISSHTGTVTQKIFPFDDASCYAVNMKIKNHSKTRFRQWTWFLLIFWAYQISSMLVTLGKSKSLPSHEDRKCQNDAVRISADRRIDQSLNSQSAPVHTPQYTTHPCQLIRVFQTGLWSADWPAAQLSVILEHDFNQRGLTSG